MKFCKNCGHESEDGKIRCGYCGYLFEDEMDNVLREINTNLNNYKNDLTANQSATDMQGVAFSAENSTANAAVTQNNEELKIEIANLKGQISAMQGELNRMSQRGSAATPNQVIYHTSAHPAQPNTYVYPTPAQNGVYSQAATPSTIVSGQGDGNTQRTKKERKKSRIVLACITLLLLALSIASFFFAWIKNGFTGFDAVKYTFGLGGESFGEYCDTVAIHAFPGPAFIPALCKHVCTFIVKYGIVVYAALLILGFPVLFSLGGKIRFKGWHSFFAWTSSIVSLLIFGVVFWVSGFSVMTYFFIGGVAANILRGFFLLFYR